MSVAAWRRWFGPPVRDAILAVVVTVILLFGSYGEAHPTQPVRPTSSSSGHRLPHTPRPR